MAKLARALYLLDTHHLPVHVTPAVRLMIENLAKNLGGISGFVISQLSNPALTDLILKMLGEQGSLFSPLLHNTISPTMLKASDKTNVIPCEVTLGMDGRLVPGAKPEDMIRELHALLGQDVQFEVFKAEPGPASPSAISRSPPTTSCMHAPLQLPDGFNFASTIHAADERVPVVALDFGVAAIYKALQQFHA